MTRGCTAAPTKRCGKCGEEKPLTEFQRRSESATPKSRCKTCQAEYLREWRAANPERVRQYNARCDRGKRYTQNRAWKFRNKYGITVEQFEALLEQQGGACRICGDGIAVEGCAQGRGARRGNAVVDHDHETGRVRGLLCITCNLLLGYAKDDPQVLSRAIEYLREAARAA